MSTETSESLFYAHTRLPTEHGTFDLRILQRDGKEHLVMSMGDLKDGEGILVRVHSECLTSEVFGSLKCDCKAQLDLALGRVAREGLGCVIYLRQEGRGIGLGNKIRAYALQDQGADTVDANRLLGLGDDLRTYEAAADMLNALGVKSIRLMTNNPEKIEGLTSHGIEIEERVQTVAGVNDVNRGYIETKTRRMRHLINEEVLDERDTRWRVV